MGIMIPTFLSYWKHVIMKILMFDRRQFMDLVFVMSLGELCSSVLLEVTAPRGKSSGFACCHHENERVQGHLLSPQCTLFDERCWRGRFVAAQMFAYSYPEDQTVFDPLLEQHLSFFGIAQGSQAAQGFN